MQQLRDDASEERHGVVPPRPLLTVIASAAKQSRSSWALRPGLPRRFVSRKKLPHLHAAWGVIWTSYPRFCSRLTRRFV